MIRSRSAPQPAIRHVLAGGAAGSVVALTLIWSLAAFMSQLQVRGLKVQPFIEMLAATLVLVMALGLFGLAVLALRDRASQRAS